MLPSFRLIAATFLCSFFVVFAGLRLAASLNDMHEALPVMAAQAAPVSIAPVADREMRHGLSSVPVMYDLRFAVSTLAPTLVRVAPTLLDRPAFPPAILPPQDQAQDPTPESSANLGAEPANDVAPAESAVAAIKSEVQDVQAPSVIPDAPAEPPAPKAPELAAIDTQAKPNATADWPAAETPASETKSPEAKAAENRSTETKTAAIAPQPAPPPGAEEPLALSEPAAATSDTPAVSPDPVAASPAAIPEPAPEAAMPEMATPTPKARAAAKPSHHAKAKAKVVRKKPIRTAHSVPPASPFGYSSSNPFGTQRP